ncbi:MAG TPA: crosslink repair DNA glycosylase YcaQ family protein [Candidatus Kryptonia bacterium]
MSEFTEKSRSWSYHRQLLGKRATWADKALREIVGVSGLNQAGALSLRARVKSFDAKNFLELDCKRLALRITGMRRAVYMVPAENAGAVFSATAADSQSPLSRNMRTGPSALDKKYRDLREMVEKVAISPLSPVEIADAIGIPFRNIRPVISRMTSEGRLLAVGSKSIHSNCLSYVSARSWSDRFAPVERRKALTWLAAEYIRAFGPVRIKDYRWWAGTTPDCAIGSFMENDIAEIESGYFILKNDLPSYDRFRQQEFETVDLLPLCDPYITGYAPDGRERFVDRKFQTRIFGKVPPTIEQGVVLVNGTAKGTWNYGFVGGKMIVYLKMFVEGTGRLNSAINEELNQVAELFQVKSMVVRAR